MLEQYYRNYRKTPTSTVLNDEDFIVFILSKNKRNEGRRNGGDKQSRRHSAVSLSQLRVTSSGKLTGTAGSSEDLSGTFPLSLVC